MNYADYLAQQPQQPQEPQEGQQAQANRLDMMRAQLDAEKYYTLLAEARQAVPFAADPGQLAATLTALLFGEDSTEAGIVARLIEQARRPGGYELAIDAARQRRALLKKQLDKLAEQEKEIAAQMGLAAADERELMAEQTPTGPCWPAWTLPASWQRTQTRGPLSSRPAACTKSTAGAGRQWGYY